MRTVAFLGLVVGLVLIVSCKPNDPVYHPGGGSGEVSLSGKITYKGEPLPGGVLTMHAKDDPKKTVPASLTRQGTYQFTSALEGDVVFTLETESIKGQDVGQIFSKGAKGKDNPGPQHDGMNLMPKYVKIDKKYENIKTSGMAATLTKGANTKDFELK
jgi:hypothetical protein